MFLATLLYLLTLTAAADCSSPRYDESVAVKRIIDGDTLQLTDGRRLRLIGINTPERGKKGRPSEPLAEQATRMLASLADTRIKLRWGVEKQDRYGRLLVHAFTQRGDNISARLLTVGMGAAIQIPPNLWAYRCYLKAEKAARTQHLGIWNQPYFTPLDAGQLAPDSRGFHFVRGRLSRVGHSKTALWLNLGERFALRIHKKDLAYFQKIHFDRLIGKQLTARGWIYTHKGQLRMNLHHPASLVIKE